MWPVCWQDSNIDSIWTIDRWNRLFFRMFIQIHKDKSWSNILCVGMIKNGWGILKFMGLYNWLYLKKKTLNKLIFCMLVNSRKLKVDFCVGMVKNSNGLLVQETLKPACLKNKFINWAYCLNGDSDVIIFGLTDVLLIDFKMYRIHCSCTSCLKSNSIIY